MKREMPLWAMFVGVVGAVVFIVSAVGLALYGLWHSCLPTPVRVMLALCLIGGLMYFAVRVAEETPHD